MPKIHNMGRAGIRYGGYYRIKRPLPGSGSPIFSLKYLNLYRELTRYIYVRRFTDRKKVPT